MDGFIILMLPVKHLLYISDYTDVFYLWFIWVYFIGIKTEVTDKFCWAEFLRSSGTVGIHLFTSISELKVLKIIRTMMTSKLPFKLILV